MHLFEKEVLKKMRPLLAKRTPVTFCFHTAFHLQPVCQLFGKICIRLNGFGHPFNRSIHRMAWSSVHQKHQPIQMDWSFMR